MSYALDRLSQLEEEGEAPSQVAPGRQTLTSRLAPRPLDQRPRDAGEPSDRLPAPVQAQMGAAFGLHLGGVSVERDSTFATSVGAEAVAHDGRLHFAPGMYDPGSTSGLSLIGHEVAHLAQQTDGRATQAQAKGEGESPELEAEAEALGSRAAAGEVGLLGDGTLRTPTRSSAVQRRPTRWMDLNENGVGVVWDPHKTAATGAAHQPGRAVGTGARVDGAPAAQVNYLLATESGGRGMRVTNLGAAQEPIAHALNDDPAAVFGGRNYRSVPMLPLARGGSGDRENLVALPPDAHDALDKLHNAIAHLVGNGYVNAQVVVDQAADNDARLYYASQVRARWAQIGANGAEVPGTVGEYVVQIPRPTGVDQGAHSARHATLMFGAPNQANGGGAPPVHPGARKAELQTTIDFGAVTGDGDATRMKAEPLGADHGIGEQPKDGVWKQRTGVLHNAAGKRIRYIAGHLLNHHLGGPGNDARNLAPIPEDVNKEHESQVEHPVKELVRAGHWVSYEMVVRHAVDVGAVNYPSGLLATWAQLDAAGAVIPTTRKQVDLPIQAPSAYSGAPNQPGKKTPKLATSNVVGAGVDADNRIGATTTLGFHEVMLEDTGTLGPQVKVMKPLVAALLQMGLNAHFVDDPQLGTDVFSAMAAVKPSAEECEARDAIEHCTQELRALTVAADLDGADDVMHELRDELARFTYELRARADATHDAAMPLLNGQYATDRANEFGALLRQEGERAQRDLELTTASTEAVIELAQRMLYQQRQAQRVHEVPMTPSQALAVNDDEVHYNDEQQDAADDSIGARHQMFGRRLGDPGVMLFHLPESRRSADRVLGLLRAGSQHWPLAAGSGMSQEATTIGSSIEALLRGGVSVDAMELVVRSLYETNTRAFNEYTEWLEQRFDEGPAQASSSQGGGSLDFGGGSPDFGGGSPGFDGGSPGFDGGSPDYTGLYDPDDPFQ